MRKPTVRPTFFEKAFEKVDRKFWLRLEERGINGKCLEAIKAMYNKVTHITHVGLTRLHISRILHITHIGLMCFDVVSFFVARFFFIFVFSISQVLVGSTPLKPYGFDKDCKHTYIHKKLR